MPVDLVPYRRLQESFFADGDHPAVLREWLGGHGEREVGLLGAGTELAHDPECGDRLVPDVLPGSSPCWAPLRCARPARREP